jgi:hypothetical protein
MPSNTRNVKLGICQVFYDGKDLGYTKGGVEVQVSTETYKVEVDQFGKSAISETIQGRTVSVTCPLAETTIENLLDIMPGTTLISDGARAQGSVTFSGQPAAASVVTIAGEDFTFVSTSPADNSEVKIGPNLGETLDNLIFTINNHFWSATSTVYLAGGLRAELDATNPSKVNLTALDLGTLGNAITLVAGGTSNGTVSAATMTAGAVSTRSRVEVSSGAGINMIDIAKTLRLHPTNRDPAGGYVYDDDFILYAAAPAGSLQYAYQVDSERIFNVTFSAYPDAKAGVGARLFSIGDPFHE